MYIGSSTKGHSRVALWRAVGALTTACLDAVMLHFKQRKDLAKWTWHPDICVGSVRVSKVISTLCVFLWSYIFKRSTINHPDERYHVYIYIQIDTRHGGFHQVIIYIYASWYIYIIYIYLCLIHVGTPSPNSSGHYSSPTQVLFAIDPEQMLWPSRSLRHCTAICWRTLVLVTLGYQPV